MVKVHKLVAAIATTITLSTTTAYALELGDISWQSFYGQPLKAKIALKDTAGVKASEISSMLSNSTKFDDLPSLSFNPVILNNGSGYIEVKSTTPINEPFLTFAVDLEYNGDKQTKEYNVLLDMPDKTNTESTKASTRSAHTAAKTNTDSSYRTRRGETLWAVAQKSYNSKVTAKAAKAIYDKNPKAFINGQPTQILADYTLRLPSMQEVNAISVAEANAFLNNKTVANNTQTNSKNIKDAEVIKNKLSESEQALANARNENEQLSSQLENLQAEIEKLKVLAEEKDLQITEIKTKLVEEPIKKASPSAQPVTKTDNQPKSTQPATPTQTNEPKPGAEPKPTVTPPVAPEKNSTATKEPKEQVKTPAQPKPQPKPARPVYIPEEPIVEEPSLLSSLLGNQTMMMAAGGGVVLLCLIALLIRRKKKMSDDAEEVDLSDVSLDNDALLVTPELDTKNTIEDEDPVSKLGEGMGVLDKVDIYLLYHHYDQAKALLKTALEEDPTNTEYYLKLLDILAEKDDREAFANESEHLLLIDPMAQHKIDAIKTKYNLTSTTTQGQGIASTNDALTSFTENKDMLFDNDLTSLSNDSFTPNLSLDQDDTTENDLQKSSEDFSFHAPLLTETQTTSDEVSLDNTSDFFNSIQQDDHFFTTETEESNKQEKQSEDFSFDIYPGDHVSSPDKKQLAEDEIIPLETPISATVTAEDEQDDIIEKDQVTTKLELVNAYINMNDDEGAQDLLQEIIREGNETQKAEAQKLLATLTGNSASVPFSPSVEQSSAPSTEHENTALTELDLGFSLPPEDEVVTKLELAKAYVDMGDKAGAKDILEEVLSEGSEAQKQEALELIRSLS